MDLHKSIDASWVKIQRARLNRRESSLIDSIDELDEGEGPSLDPNEALTASSQKEFLEWMMVNERHKENYTKEDLGAMMGDVTETDTKFLTSSFISFNQAQNRQKWIEFKKAGVFKKILHFPKQCFYEIAKSCLINAQHLSVKFFFTKFPLYRELNIILMLYIYNIILQPRILSTILPLLLTYSAFAIMTAYSCRIFIANIDLLFSFRNIIPLMTDKAETRVFVTRYFRSKQLKSYAVFSFSSLAYFLSMPISQAGSDLVTAVCFLFFLLSIPILSLGRQNLISSIAVSLYIGAALFSQVVSPVPLLLKYTTIILVLAAFIFTILRNVGLGISLRLSAPVFFLMWGQAFVVSSQFTPLDGAFLQRLILLVIITLVTITIRKYIFHFILPSVAGCICYFYLSFLPTCVIVISLFVLSNIITRFFAKHWICNWFLSLDPFEVTFFRVIWVVFIIFIGIGIGRGVLHSSHKLSTLNWDKYQMKCTPPNGWENANEAMYQLRCLHLTGRTVSLRGRVLSVSLNSRENSMEYYFNKLQVFYLGDGLKCLFGQSTLSQEECDLWKEDFDQDICRYSKCSISLGAKFTFEIKFENFPDTVTPNMKIEASSYFRDEIIGLNVGEVINVTAEILNPGSKLLNLKLKCMEKLQNKVSVKKCTSQFGISIPKLKKYLENLYSLIFALHFKVLD